MLKLVFVFSLTVCAALGEEGFYNIAHMTNTPAALSWAVNQGANAVELDLDFDHNGNPTSFYHGSPCDCTCMPGFMFPNSICPLLGSRPCSARGDLEQLLSMVALDRHIAMVLIDSKVPTHSESVMQYAGTQVASLLSTHLLQQGYDGKIVVGASYEASFPYIMSVATAFSENHADNVFYSLDLVPDVGQRLRKLHTLPSRNIIYSHGKTACSPTRLNSETLQLAVANKAANTVGMTCVWSVDRQSTMESNIPFVDGILSNYPQIVRQVALASGRPLATRQSSIPRALGRSIVTNLSNYRCECTYSRGGCRVTTPPPPNTACYCHYRFLWTCSGYISLCNKDHPLCSHPDTSRNSCMLGGGDCGGY